MNRNNYKLTIYDNPRRTVNILTGTDRLACMLGAAGLGVDAIAMQTGLSKGQVLYRLKQGMIKIGDYRRGNSVMAQKIVRYAKASLTTILERQLIKALKAPPPKKAIDIEAIRSVA